MLFITLLLSYISIKRNEIPVHYFIVFILLSIATLKFLFKEYYLTIIKKYIKYSSHKGYIEIKKAHFENSFTLGYIDIFSGKVKINLQNQEYSTKIPIENIISIAKL